MKKNTKIIIAVVTVTIAIIPVLFIGLMFFGIKKGFQVQDSGCEGVTILSNPVFNVDKFKSTRNAFVESFFGKDNDKVYRIASGGWEEKLCVPIEDADYNTFEVLSKYHAKDKNNAYLQYYDIRKNADKNQYTIFGVDNESFIILDGDGYYSKDKKGVYYRTDLFKGVDAETFELLRLKDNDIKYTKDRNNVFLHSKILSDLSGKYSEFTRKVDTKTFEVLDKMYAKDKNYIYDYNGIVIDGADSATFKYIGEKTCTSHVGIKYICKHNYDAEDKNNKYYDGHIVNLEKNNKSKNESVGYEGVELKRIDFEKEQPFIQGYADVSPGSVDLNQGIDKSLKLTTKAGQIDNLSSAVISAPIDVPLDADSMQFRFQLMTDGRATPGALFVYFNQDVVHTITTGPIKDQGVTGMWRDTIWIKGIDKYAGGKMDLTFWLRREGIGNNESIVMNLDNIVFLKTAKKNVQ